METRQAHAQQAHAVSRRGLLKAGLVAGVTLSAWPLHSPTALWGAEAGSPKRGGILRVRGWDPVHFDPHLTFSFKTHTTLSFVYSKLLRYRGEAGMEPGAFFLEPDVGERWEGLDATTYVFPLRPGGTWSNKPP